MLKSYFLISSHFSGNGTRGRGFSRGGRGVAMGRSESRFSRDGRSERPPFEV